MITATDLELHRTSEFSACAGLQSTTPPPPADPPDDPPPGTAPGGGDPPGSVTPLDVPGIIVPPVVEDPPSSPPCEVPKLTGLTPAKAKQRLKRAGCRAGRIDKPRRPRGGRHRLVVKRASRKAGSIHDPGTAVGLTLKWVRVKPPRR